MGSEKVILLAYIDYAYSILNIILKDRIYDITEVDSEREDFNLKQMSGYGELLNGKYKEILTYEQWVIPYSRDDKLNEILGEE